MLANRFGSVIGLVAAVLVSATTPLTGFCEDAPTKPAVQRPTGPFQFVSGDRVALIGDTLIERAAREELLETTLSLLTADKSILFRNLGWSADTVFGDSRAGFGTAADGFKQLTQQVRDFQPTVVLVVYTNAMSSDREAGLARLNSGYAALLDMLAGTKAIVILVSATPHEALPAPYPKPDESNRWRETYSAKVRDLAAQRELKFVDLYAPLAKEMEAARRGQKFASPELRLTDNGIHFNPRGYWLVSRHLAGGLGLDPSKLPLSVGPKGQLTVGGKATDASTVRAEAIRQKIAEKNLLFFHRWRPQNETYLFGFRKHEQGQNAKEIPMFDPLIEKVEAEIATLLRSK